MGGIPAAFAADIFPRKIAAIAFLTAFMPDTRNPPAYVLEKLSRSTSQEEWLDTVFGTYGRPDCPLEFALAGPKSMAKNSYQLSPPEDLELAKMLVRVNPIVTNNLAGTRSFSEERYGSVTRIYIVCGEDARIPEEYQRWMISNFPVNEVMEIKEADHMAMFSKPQELCARLLEVAVKTQLEAAGHSVTAVDLAASGINMTRVEEIQTLKDYSKPLLDVMGSLGSEKKGILVAHSMGGISAALAADTFPCKTAAIVFLTSSMPDTKNSPAYVLEKRNAGHRIWELRES
ncbi:hypothetical protein AALP_AA6G278800 [Arabis alpina]|uniref:AB hydrolase-1 domain-containing protein n=1 Tax=Arabis alpina TaxID=50452 RepID=A0A087GS60_ARAAL|nr:hypothetical protein AALP_AA6G278800 [Arabis alpina]